MSLVRFLSYPVYFNPSSRRAVAYVMEHFYRIRSYTWSRRLLKILVRPALPFLRRRGRNLLTDCPDSGRLIPYLEGGNYEVVIDARRFFRLIDFDRRRVLNIFKGNDAPSFFDNEVTARQRLAGAGFIPRLIAVDQARRIFVDEYVCEQPFKSGSLRHLNPVEFTGQLKRVLDRVRRGGSVRPVEAGEYASGLSRPLLDRPEARGDIRRYLKGLEAATARLGRIDLVYSHGDFRKDQIFFSAGGDIKVIDWECSGYFSSCFDIMEFFITEKWLYANPLIGLADLLGTDVEKLQDYCSLYLLELCHHPIRFHGNCDLIQMVPIIKGVERRLRRYGFRRD